MKFYGQSIKKTKEDTHHTSVLSSGILLSYNKQWQAFTCVCCLCSFAFRRNILSSFLFGYFRRMTLSGLLSDLLKELVFPVIIQPYMERCLINNLNQISQINVAHYACSADAIMVSVTNRAVDRLRYFIAINRMIVHNR